LTLPWPVFCHFLDAIAASGDIVDDPLSRITFSGEEAGPGPNAIEGRRPASRWVVPPASNPRPRL
jgi:hypothetical protein